MILLDYPKNGYCHMVADNLYNLHDFAMKLGVKKCWYHGYRRNKPHYDLKESLINKALELVAQQVTSKEIVVFLKMHYD